MRISFLFLFHLILSVSASAQLTLAFQGGENTPDDTWSFASTGEGPEAIEESQSPPNIKSGTFSMVVGGTDPAGGSCFGGGTGNGAAIDNIFTFEAVDLTAYPDITKTLEFWYGSRQPYCNGTGWDMGEDLIFTPIIDGTELEPIVLETGGGELSPSITETSYVYEVPGCAMSFGFKLMINLNRRDELLFLDDVSLSADGNPEPVLVDAGPDGEVCAGSDINLSGVAGGNLDNISWSGGAGSFSDSASPNTVYTAGDAEEGVVTLTLTAVTACGLIIESETEILVTGNAPETGIESSLGNEICPGQVSQLTAFGGNDYLWSTGQSGESISISEPGTYSVEVSNECGSETLEIIVEFADGPVVILPADTLICQGEEIILTPAGEFAFYSWSTGSEEPLIIAGAGTYVLTVTDEAGCEGSGTVSVLEGGPEAAFGFTPSGTVGPETVVVFNNQSESGGAAITSQEWNFGDGTVSTALNPEHQYTNSGAYSITLTVTDENGCTSTAEATISVTFDLRIPGGFSPNGDGVGDLFVIRGLEAFPGSILQIFNRWGAVVFETTFYNNDWDGDNLPAGTYFYILKIRNGDDFAGPVTLVR
ncbi:MAG: gliding motility-associated C-terminal domain-containing protein [Cryomorphaceae bacterium]